MRYQVYANKESYGVIIFLKFLKSLEESKNISQSFEFWSFVKYKQKRDYYNDQNNIFFCYGFICYIDHYQLIKQLSTSL